MIDLIINETGGLTVAHCVKALDVCDGIDIDLASGDAVLSGPGISMGLGKLQPAMLEALRPGMAGQAIRTSGWSIARVSAIAVRTQAPTLH